MLAWGLWLATFGCLAAGLVVTVAVVRPLTLPVLAAGTDVTDWPLAAQLNAVVGDLNWVTPIALGSPYRRCCSPDGHLRSRR